MGFLGNFFNLGGGNNDGDDLSMFDPTAKRSGLKTKLRHYLKLRGFSNMEIEEIMDVITLAEADIKIAEDSLAHININNPDPTRSIHAALQDIRRYEKELAYNLRKKILDILARKVAMRKSKK